MPVINRNKIFEKAKTANVPQVQAFSSDYSFGVVNSKNGKRLTFSKALSKKLGLTETVDILPIIEEGILLVSADLPFEAASTGTVNKDERKICYGAALVALVTESFKLDFTGKTSMSFSDISIEDYEGQPFAFINIGKPEDDTDEENV